MASLFTLANPKLAALQPYVPGKPVDELKRELGLSDVVKLASNENPLGVSPAVPIAIAAALQDVARYPDGNGFALKQAIAAHYAVDTSQITLGNGSNDVLDLIVRCFAAGTDEVVYSQYAFAVYAIATQSVGAVGVEVPALNYGHDLPAMLAAIGPQCKMVFVANPNNPTGTYFNQAALLSFIQQVPAHVLVVLDEAYVEYDPTLTDSVALLRQFSNLIICRSFSKAYGLAGLRVGFALASSGVTEVLNRVRQPFNVNSLAQAAAIAALHDQAFVEATRQHNNLGMAQMLAGLAQLGLQVLPSKGNFVCVQLPMAGQVLFEQLLKLGVIVRPLQGYAMHNFVRISIGTTSENDSCLSALKQVLGGTYV